MDLLSFSTGYTAQDQNQISFNWNGKHANEFFDSNQQFRRNIISFVIENDQLYFPVDLIRDLFLEEANGQFKHGPWDMILIYWVRSLLDMGKISS